MFRRHLREKTHHQWTDKTGEQGQHASSLCHLHQPQEQGHHADQPKSQFHGSTGRFHHGLGQGFHGRELSLYGHPVQLMPTGGEKGNQDNGKEDNIHLRP